MGALARHINEDGPGAEPPVSVVIPTFQPDEVRLNDAIASALRQSFSPHEVVVVDDGSRTPVVLSESLPTKVRVIRHRTNRGPAAARNTGVANADGTVVAFLDHDDVWHEDVLRLHVTGMATHSCEASAVAGFSALETQIVDRAFPRSGRLGFLDIAARTVVHTMSAFAVQKRAYVEVGGMDEARLYCDDLDFYLRFSRHYAIAGTPVACVRRTLHDQNLTRNAAAWAQELLAVFDNWRGAALTSHEYQTLWDGINRRCRRLRDSEPTGDAQFRLIHRSSSTSACGVVLVLLSGGFVDPSHARFLTEVGRAFGRLDVARFGLDIFMGGRISRVRDARVAASLLAHEWGFVPHFEAASARDGWRDEIDWTRTLVLTDDECIFDKYKSVCNSIVVRPGQSGAVSIMPSWSQIEESGGNVDLLASLLDDAVCWS